MKVTTLGIDIAKTVFHLIGLDTRGHEVLNKKVTRSHLTKTIQNLPPCRITMESCGSANYWGREFLKMGHEVILIPPPVCEALRADEQERCQ